MPKSKLQANTTPIGSPILGLEKEKVKSLQIPDRRLWKERRAFLKGYARLLNGEEAAGFINSLTSSQGKNRLRQRRRKGDKADQRPIEGRKNHGSDS